MDGKRLRFQLYGINNQNFIMRDRETGTWWQQVSGEGIAGPLRGKQLNLIETDELSFHQWKREHPNGRVLRPAPDIAAAKKYASANWEEQIAELPTLPHQSARGPLPPREIVIGVVLNGKSKAYPLSAIRRQSPIMDKIGDRSILIVQADDALSIRAFETTLDGKEMEFFARPNASPLLLIDTTSGSEWDFSGTAVSGPLQGKRLKKITILKDYWFDWKAYHPDTVTYK